MVEHRWIVERRSLADFVMDTAERRVEQAEALRKARRREYRWAKGVLRRLLASMERATEPTAEFWC